ncbi:molybdopterin molybdotransferase MoeA [Algoriphagus sp.]|uniref:molybdopterin molybdotransferase MoeA n=1 Tax=Algoriphagus sp. TaxID=1872435 RepID=UPI00271A026A|nr:molybdopterin molybdotransferase MoeA [Algoriphagus sp.]MDO8966680.1 molybdopterin molybdotransferase MoeA [Algoriphagus sp.]MDP3198935.1 molybdopterin molybdotransferase MoeA [Algoriphagus sp.]
MKEFVTVSEAKSILKSQKIRGGSVHLSLQKSLGKFTASPVLAPMDVPSFDNSGMDGYAIIWDEKGEGREVVEVIQAGAKPDFVLEKGKAVRIFTGAPVPEGADTVIPQEEIVRTDKMIFFNAQKFFRGANVRKKGAQCKVGWEAVPAGTKITPGTIGLLASLGIREVAVFPSPKVSLILTGDEILDLGNELLPGQIYNSNGPALESYFEMLGIHEVKIYKVKDEASEVTKVISEALENSDFLLLTGGISVGDYDFVKGSLEQNGVEQLFYKIRQRPGKPLFVGKRAEKLIFALPGNPASVLSCFSQYVKPCLLEWMGNPQAWNGPSYLPIEKDFDKKIPMTFFLKAKIDSGKVQLLPGQESFNLLPFGVADGLVEIPQDSEHTEEGSLVAFYPW